MSEVTKKRWTQSGFLVAVAILGVAAVGLNAAVQSLQLHFKKQPVALRRELADIPTDLGNWVQVSKDEPLDKEVQDALGTTHYVIRDYVNKNLISSDQLKEFDGKDSHGRQALLAQLQGEHPEAVVELGLYYYTGLVDTVAHVPDRCYVADGFEPSEYETPKWDLGPNRLGKKPGDEPAIEVRYINFEDQTAAGRVTRRVAYFFHTEGQFESDPLNVRKQLQDLRKRHGYYAKIELSMQLKDHDQCQAVMQQFLRCAMPEIENCLPDWDAVEHAGGKS